MFKDNLIIYNDFFLKKIERINFVKIFDVCNLINFIYNEKNLFNNKNTLHSFIPFHGEINFRQGIFLIIF